MSNKIEIDENSITHKLNNNDKFKMRFSTSDIGNGNAKSMIVTGDILPVSDATYQLGSGSKRFSHIFQGTSSLYMGDDSLLTVLRGRMVIRNRKDGNLIPPPVWHNKQALFKYGIKTTVQKDPISFKVRNYIGTIIYSEKITSQTSATSSNSVAYQHFTIADTSNTAESEYDNFYEGWYIDTVDNGGSRVYAKIEDPDLVIAKSILEK